MKTPFILVVDHVSADTVECLKMLLRQARAGEIVGLAYCAMLKKRAFIVNTTGTAHESPTFTRGMLTALDDQLSTRVRGGSP